jgi:hypothetical protein
MTGRNQDVSHLSHCQYRWRPPPRSSQGLADSLFAPTTQYDDSYQSTVDYFVVQPLSRGIG